MSDPDWLVRQDWTAADLDANRGGRLSQAQIDRLRVRTRSYVLRTVAWTAPIPLVGLAVALGFLIAQNEPALFVFPVGGLFVAVPLLAFVFARARSVAGDLRDGRVAVAEGTIAGMFINIRTGQARVRIGQTPMQCWGPGSDRAWRELQHYLGDCWERGTEVRVYYLLDSRLVVSAEPKAHSIQ